MSQAALGAPYLTRAGISAIERAVSSPSIHLLAHLARRLKVPVTALLDAGDKHD